MNVNLRDWGKKLLTSEYIVVILVVTIAATYFTIDWIGYVRDNQALAKRGVYVIARITGCENRGKSNTLYVYVAYWYNKRKYTTVLHPEYYFAPRAGDYIYLHILPDQPDVLRYVEYTPVPECMTVLAEEGQVWKEIPSCNTYSLEDSVQFIPAVKDQPFIKENMQDGANCTPQYIATHKLSGQLIRLRDEKIVGIRSFVNGLVRGEELQSFPDGKIHHYVLRVDAVNATFFRTYTPEGKIWYEEGTPIIHKEVRSFRDGEVDIRLVVADRIFRNMEISCLVDGERYIGSGLTEDAACWPYKICHLTARVSRKYDSELTLQVNCVDKYSGTRSRFLDTLHLPRRR